MVAALGAAVVAGCASAPTSGIDPTGDRVFAAPASPSPTNPSNERYHDEPMGKLPWDDAAVQLQPRETVAPVGSEVVLVAGVCGSDGYLRTNRRLEWSIDPGSVGQFVAVAENRLVDMMLGDFNRPRKVTNTFVIGSTLRDNVRLNRGTCLPDEQVYVLRGQSWVSLTSTTEGTSHVTVFAPEVYGWNARLKSATVHWVDAQWRLPPPAINPAGTKHVFTTTVTRQSNQSPCEGWRVRYEISSGPPAGFSPDGAQTIEVPTNSAGQASAEIFQKQPAHGTNKICIQIVRPGELPGAGGQRLVVGSGTTTITTGVASESPASPGASPIGISISTPPQVAVGNEVTFDIVVTNRGQTPATNLRIKDRFEPGLEHEKAVGTNSIDRALGNLAPGASQQIRVTFRATKPGRLCHTVEVTGPTVATATAEGCVVAVGGDGGPAFGDGERTRPEPLVASPLLVKKTGPDRRVVGEVARFIIEVRNAGTTPLRNIKIIDRYDPPLVPTMATDGYRLEGANLTWTIDSLAAGKATQLEIHCDCKAAAAKTCNRASVTTADGDRAESEACLEIVATGTPAPDSTQAAPAGDGLAMSIVDLGNPVAAGRGLTYMIRVANNSLTSHRQVSVTATVPEGMVLDPLGTSGPDGASFTREGRQTIHFDPAAELRPGGVLTYHVRVLAKQVGSYRLHAELTTSGMSQPLVQESEKPTEVFQPRGQ